MPEFEFKKPDISGNVEILLTEPPDSMGFKVALRRGTIPELREAIVILKGQKRYDVRRGRKVYARLEQIARAHDDPPGAKGNTRSLEWTVWAKNEWNIIRQLFGKEAV